MKAYRYSYQKGVTGMSKNKVERIFAKDRSTADKQFKEAHKNFLDNERSIERVKILEVVENDLPELTDEEIKRAGGMFSGSDDPINDMKILKFNRELKNNK